MTKQRLEEGVFIGLGSNLADPVYQLRTAREAIAGLEMTAEIAFSSLYTSPPMGPQDQPDYTNAVMQISTDLQPIPLLRALQNIENEQGRVRNPGQRWGARTLDLDILLFGQQLIQLPDLIVPHPGMATRAFVLYPLQEIAANIHIPGCGDLPELVTNCPLSGLVKT